MTEKEWEAMWNELLAQQEAKFKEVSAMYKGRDAGPCFISHLVSTQMWAWVIGEIKKRVVTDAVA